MMAKSIFIICGLIIVIVGQCIVNAGSGKSKSDAESMLGMAADASEIAKNAQEIKDRHRSKKKPKKIRNKRQKFTNNGMMGYAEDIDMMKHDRSILNKKIYNSDVMPGDIVACLMKSGNTQHYAIVIDGTGTTVGFGYYDNGIKKTDVLGIPLGNVKGHFEYLKAENLSESYKNKCAVLKNAYNTHFLNVDDNSPCSKQLSSAYEKWSVILADRINKIKSLNLMYNVMECNCQIIGSYLAYGFLNERVNCVTENGDKILRYRNNKHRTNVGEVNDAYIDYYLTCRE